MKDFFKTDIKLLLSLILILTLFLQGCLTVGPDYKTPGKQVSAAWYTTLKNGLVPDKYNTETLASWWTTFNDPELSNLINRALSGNLDIKTAKAKIREVRAKSNISKAKLFPSFDATGSTAQNLSNESTGNNETTVLYNTGFDASWEVDVFGGVRRSVEADEADLEASNEDLRDILVTLIAEVARNYISVRTYQNRIAAMQANYHTLKETLELAQWRFEAGLTDDLAVQQALYNLENVRSQIPSLLTGLEETMNVIAVLLGEQPGTIHKELELPKPIPSVSINVAVGVPADTIRHRPDIRRAERELAAQTARVGVAVADLYPKFTLNGSIGLESPFFNKIFSITSGITQPIFHGGAIRQNIEIQSALQEQAVIKYESTLLKAFEEVENIMKAYIEEQNKRDALYLAETAAKNAAALSQQKFETGLVDFISVLDAQRSHLTFQDQLAQSKGNVSTNLAKLYKALGGGWKSICPEKNK